MTNERPANGHGLLPMNGSLAILEKLLKIRQLEAELLRLRKELPKMLPQTGSVEKIFLVQFAVAERMGVDVKCFWRKDKVCERVTNARLIATDLCSVLCEHKAGVHAEIGLRFNRDRSAIGHALRIVRTKLEVDHRFAKDWLNCVDHVSKRLMDPK